MKRIIWLLAILLVGIGVAVFSGCSNDDKTTNSTGKLTGDPNDPSLDAMGTVFDQTQGMTQQMFFYWMGVLDTVLNDPGNPGMPGQFRMSNSAELGDTIYLTYHSNTNYWYVYVEQSEYFWYGQGSDSSLVTFTLADSVQFMHGTTPAQWPDSALLTGINTGVHATIVPDGQGFSAEGSQKISIVGDIFAMGDVTINGTQSTQFSYSDTTYGCSFGSNMGATFSNLMMNLTDINNDGCPTSGKLVYSGAANISCTGDTTFTISDNWMISQTFVNDSTYFVVENSKYRWEWTETCNSQPPASNAWQTFQAIKE